MRGSARSTLALPLLPADEIRGAFAELAPCPPAVPVGCAEEGNRLLSYIRQNWIGPQARWRPEDWSSYRSLIRTTNYIEGWNNSVAEDVGRKQDVCTVANKLAPKEASFRLDTQAALAGTFNERWQTRRHEVVGDWALRTWGPSECRQSVP